MTATSGTDLSSKDLASWRRRLRQHLTVVRNLPWRATRDPWPILVSEVMLQQTQVSRVIEAWPRFLSLFPDPQSCSSAGQADVVRAWEGLGYHRRAVALFGAARTIVDRFGGSVPQGEEDLRSLPGVGIYTARAVQAFAFERDVGVVDTNVARVLSRAVAGQSLRARATQELADALVPSGSGWEHNQALLDFGALRCTSTPSCSGCPLRRSCRWARTGFAVPDPAASTAGTARPQAPFAGSDRQVRGRLLDLARRDEGTPDRLGDLEEEFGEVRVSRLIEDLVKDELLCLKSSQIVLR